MSDDNFRIIARNFHDEATLSTSLTPADGFPVTATQNCMRYRIWRSTGLTTQFIQGSFVSDGLARRVNFLGLFRHALLGGYVTLRLYSDTACTSLAREVGPIRVMGVSQFLGCAPSDGFDWGIDRFSTLLGETAGTYANDPFLDLSPFWLFFTETSCLGYRIYITQSPGSGYPTGVLSQQWAISRIVLGRYFELSHNPAYGLQIAGNDLQNRYRTRAGSLRSTQGSNFWRTMSIDLNRITDDEMAGWLDVMQWCGTGRDFAVSVYPDSADGRTRKERMHMMNGKFVSLDALGRPTPRLYTKRLQIEEV
jgi:hypothetical protein